MDVGGSDRPLSILHLTAASEAGGLSRYILDLCGAMNARGHRVAVAGGKGAWHERFVGQAWPWIDAPMTGGPLGLRRAAGVIRQYMAEHGVDVLHTHYRRPTLVARRLQQAGSPPILYTLHLSHMAMSGPRKWFSDFGDHVHAASVDGRKWLMREAKVPGERITVIPHGIEVERFPVGGESERAKARADLGLVVGDLVALFVGRLDVPKNAEWMVDLAAESREKLPNLRVLLAGTGPHEEALRGRIERDGLTGRVGLLGEKAPLPLYHAADALLLPSEREGFSYVCAEAMCTGLPVLRTRTSGTTELIEEEMTGRSVPIDRKAFIAGAMEFLRDPLALRNMGIAAAKKIRKEYQMSRQVDQTISLYRALMAGTSRAGTSSGSSGETGPVKS